jgi:hypothetical protein
MPARRYESYLEWRRAWLVAGLDALGYKIRDDILYSTDAERIVLHTVNVATSRLPVDTSFTDKIRLGSNNFCWSNS